jgi:hypothetical protein
MEQETGSSWEPGLPLKQSPTTTLVKLGEIVSKATLALWHEEADRYVCYLILSFLVFHDDYFTLLPSSLKRLIADAENAYNLLLIGHPPFSVVSHVASLSRC